MKLSPHPANFSASKCRLATLAVILGQKKGGFALFFEAIRSQHAKSNRVGIFCHPHRFLRSTGHILHNGYNPLSPRGEINENAETTTAFQMLITPQAVPG